MKDKICHACGRPFSYRKKWEKVWDEVRYCSKKCSSLKEPSIYKSRILELLNTRDVNKTICPSEVLDQEKRTDKFLMERVRSAARLLCYEEKIVITQKGKVVDHLNFKGPIRLKLNRGWLLSGKNLNNDM